MKLSYLIYFAASCFVVGLMSFILNRFGILTLLDGLTKINSYAYLIPMGALMIYVIIVLSAQRFIQVILTLFMIFTGMIFYVIVVLETPLKTHIEHTDIIVENRTFIFSGTQRFYKREGLFYTSIFECKMGEGAYCTYEVIDDMLVVSYGYYGLEEFTKVIPIKED